MYYIYGISGPSLLIESTDSMIIHGLLLLSMAQKLHSPQIRHSIDTHRVLSGPKFLGRKQGEVYIAELMGYRSDPSGSGVKDGDVPPPVQSMVNKSIKKPPN